MTSGPSPEEVTRLYLVRHGETDGNAAGRTQGRRDVPLNDTGRAQAAAVGAVVAALTPSAVYASPSSRARGTAHAIATPLGLDVIVDERLSEVDHGDLDGMTGEEMRERYAAFIASWREDSGVDVPIPGGESLRQAQGRMVAAAREIVDRHRGQDIAVVSHNLALRTLLCHALGVPLSAWRGFRVDLASLSVVEVRDGDRWAVVGLNERCHLTEAAASPIEAASAPAESQSG
ncbi:MAG: histidine phosphatase family protein [Dehalococcoidia bacterium]